MLNIQLTRQSKRHPIFKSEFCNSKLYREKHERMFTDFPQVAAVVDCSVFPIFKPAGHFDEAKHYFSGKHNIYCVKFEAGVTPTGLLISHSNIQNGAKHDKSILENRINFWSDFLKKRPNIKRINDTEQSNSWAVMLDTAYVGTNLRIIIPIKKKRNQIVTNNDKAFNKKVAKDRVIVENFFGRVKSLWYITNKRTKLSNETDDFPKISLIITTCLYLASYHIIKHPLKSQDKEYHDKINKHLSVKQNIMLEKKRTQNSNYYQKNKKKNSNIISSFTDSD